MNVVLVKAVTVFCDYLQVEGGGTILQILISRPEGANLNLHRRLFRLLGKSCKLMQDEEPKKRVCTKYPDDGFSEIRALDTTFLEFVGILVRYKVPVIEALPF